MIDKDTLINLAKLHGLKAWQQEKHYIQSSILMALSEEPMVFKGGTYLWFFHGLPRFSEDLDFTFTGKKSEDIPVKVSENLELLGIENKLKIISDDARSFSFRITAHGPLYTTDISLSYVYIEISKREDIVKRPIAIKAQFPQYELPLKLIKGMHLEEVAAEKTRAIIMREKARDVYDLYYIIKEKNIPIEKSLLDDKMQYYGDKFSKKIFLDKLKEKESYWVKELKPLIFGELPAFKDCYNAIKSWTEPI